MRKAFTVTERVAIVEAVAETRAGAGTEKTGPMFGNLDYVKYYLYFFSKISAMAGIAVLLSGQVTNFPTQVAC